MSWSTRRSLLVSPLSFLLDGSLVESPLSSFLRGLVPSDLDRRLQLERWDRHRIAVLVYRDEGQIARVRVDPRPGAEIFCFDAHSDLHRRSANVVDARLHDD